jgi:hypothetical protein
MRPRLWRSARTAIRVLALASSLALAACAHGEPPAWDAAPGSQSAAPLPARSAPAVVAAATSSAATAPLPLDASAADAPDPAALGQTHDRPDASGQAFDARALALWDAIVKDDAELALPFFFPLPAYAQVKAVGNPEGDWRHRLVANYTRDIHKLHQRLGSHAADARLLGVDVPNERARWVEPGEEYNKLGYFRVYGSKMRYAVGDRPGAIDISSLISWRGEWFVVHLSGFK